MLFLCTGNSARSIMAEGLMNAQGEPRFTAYSAGSHPSGAVRPEALRQLEAVHIPTTGFKSKSWGDLSGGSTPAKSGIRRNAVVRACATSFLLHPSNKAQSEWEWRSRIDMTKTKRSSGASLVTTSIWSCPWVSCPAVHTSRLSPGLSETEDTISIAFSIRVRFTQDRAHSLNTACSLRASSTVDAKHCSACL